MRTRQPHAKQKFDSARVDVKLSPKAVECLLDTYFGTFSSASDEEITSLALAYADHSRKCALLNRALMHLAWPVSIASLLLTDVEPADLLHNDTIGPTELERRFGVALTAMEHVSR